MLRVSLKLSKLKVNRKKLKANLKKQLEIGFRKALKEWFITLILETSNASQGSGFPVKTGALVRSLKPISRFLRLSGMLPSDSPKIKFDNWKDAANRRAPRTDFTSEIVLTGVFSGHIVFSFNSELLHHKLNDFFGVSHISETPWDAIDKANAVFVKVFEEEMENRVNDIFEGWIETEIIAK